MEDVTDEEVQVLLPRDPDGTVLGGLVGFACHPTVMERAGAGDLMTEAALDLLHRLAGPR